MIKWLFVLITLIIELFSVYLFQSNFWGIYITFMLCMVGSIVAKITNENNSKIQNQIAFGLFFGTISVLIILALYVLWLMSRMH